uniref:Uncharacterized protein n=1 Tax=Avena sativa TaxID=4498 RepID=A0ACD5XXD0_AVESA
MGKPAAGEELAAAGYEGKQQQRAHFVFIPLMAQGHVIPSLDTALLLASQGAVCSMVATPWTAARIRPCIEQCGLEVRLLEFPLEYVSDGADNLDNIPPERVVGYFQAVALLQAPIQERLGKLEPRVSCIVSDFSHPWTAPVAAALGVPRISFFPMCAFCALSEHNVHEYNKCLCSPVSEEVVAVPLLDTTLLEMRRVEAPCFFRHASMGTLGEDIQRAHAQGAGMIFNTFLELEPDHVAGLSSAWGGKKVWTVGPVSLHHQLAAGGTTTTCRGEASMDDDDCLQWLDGKEAGSVVYVSFGTIAPKMEPETVLELARALETSGHPFIWALSKADHPFAESSQELQELEARVAASGGGRIVRGWVPQLLILSHAAVGCLFTHSGWNSVMEAITAGKPAATWPRLIGSDHFVNEKFTVEVLRIGVSVRPEDPHIQPVEVRREAIQAALTAVLEGGDEGQERRNRVRDLSLKAKAAMQPGGSSHANLCDLVQRFTI